MNPPLRNKTQRAAFTLVELLAAVAVIGVLTALSIPAWQRMSDRMDIARCLSDLRQIGLGIQSYSGEHNMMLPGPLRISQKGTYTITGTDHLLHHIAIYLGYPEPTSQPQRGEIFYCPAWKRVAANPNDPNATTYNCYSWNPEGKSVEPFGYTGDSTNPSKPPLSLAGIANPSKQAALYDQDIRNKSGVTTIVHKTSRNYLFLDWHVENVPAKAVGQYKYP